MESVPGVAWLPPVKQGDLYRAALRRPVMIGIVDGFFETVPTVWHKEILWAMAEGIRVYGAASIGALRAVELGAFGMKGVGSIFEAYRDGVLEDDDEVALQHGPEELGFLPVTEAMVNVRATLKEALRVRVIGADLAAGIADTAKAIFYKDRTYPVILNSAAVRGFPADQLHRFECWLPAGRVDQKRLDALAMLNTIRADLEAGLGPMQTSYRFAHTAAWEAAARHAVQEPATTPESQDH